VDGKTRRYLILQGILLSGIALALSGISILSNSVWAMGLIAILKGGIAIYFAVDEVARVTKIGDLELTFLETTTVLVWMIPELVYFLLLAQ